MAISALFRSGSKQLLQRIQTRDFKSPEEKKQLYEELAGSKDVRIGDAVRLLFSPDGELRKAVARLVSARKDQHTIKQFLLASSGRPEAARRAAITALAAVPMGEPLAVQFGRFLDDGEANMRRLAAEALFELPLDGQTSPLLSRIIDRGEAAQRLKAAQRFASVASAEHLSFFERLLDDPDERIRHAAYTTIIKFAEPRHLDVLLERIAEESYSTQQLLIEGVQKLLPKCGDDVIERVLGLLASGNTGLRNAAFKILLDMPDRVAIVRRFISYSRQLMGWVRDRALESMRAFGPEVLEPTLELLTDDDPAVRSAALGMLSSFEDPRIGQAAMKLLDDSDWWLAISAADLLGRLRYAPALPKLVEALRREEVRWAAAEAIGRVGGDLALQTLAELTQDSWPEIRVEALSALALTDDDRALPILKASAENDEKKMIRSRACELLEQLAARKQQRLDVEGVRAAVNETDIGSDGPPLHQLLTRARRERASDLHVSVDAPPTLRLGGELKRLDAEPLTAEASEGLLLGILDDEQRARLERDKQLDACFYVPNDGRYRGNLFVDRKGLNGAFRVISERPPTIDDLGLPADVAQMAQYHQGIIIVTGPSVGKSTTLAALVNLLNETRRDHILTIEDPVEFVHPFKSSLINQRDVSKHTASFAQALRAALREDPDVIVIGELRDAETVTMALTAAETGHIVLTTLNATTSAKAVDRVINSYPADEQAQVRESFSGCMKMIIAQTLVPAIEGKSRVAAFELLKGTMPILNLIRDNKTYQIASAMQIGQSAGMKTFDDSLMDLVRAKKITPETAYLRATAKEAFEPMVSARFLEELLQ